MSSEVRHRFPPGCCSSGRNWRSCAEKRQGCPGNPEWNSKPIQCVDVEEVDADESGDTSGHHDEARDAGADDDRQGGHPGQTGQEKRQPASPKADAVCRISAYCI
jgi:hypothetical protein